MAYQRSNLISRRGYSGFGDDTANAGTSIGQTIGTLLTSWLAPKPQPQPNQDLAAALAAQQAAAQNSGMDDVLKIGAAAAAGIGIVYLIRRRRRS